MKFQGVNSTGDSGPRTGDNPGSAALTFEQFRAGLYQYLLRRLHSAENAEDLSQEVYLRLLRAADLDKVRCPQAYLYRIAFNVLYEFRLRERDARVLFDSGAVTDAAEQLADESLLPEEVCEDQAKASRFERVARRLPPMQRAVLQLAAHHDLAHAQIAERLGISVSTVRNHLYKALDYCRHHLTDVP